MKTKIVYAVVSDESDVYLEQVVLSAYSLRQHNPTAFVELVVDTNNYIPMQRAKASPEDDDYWYVVRDFIYEDFIREYTDFTVDDGNFVVETTPTTTADDRIIVVNR